jgi:hypothetical protein
MNARGARIVARDADARGLEREREKLALLVHEREARSSRDERRPLMRYARFVRARVSIVGSTGEGERSGQARIARQRVCLGELSCAITRRRKRERIDLGRAHFGSHVQRQRRRGVCFASREAADNAEQEPRRVRAKPQGTHARSYHGGSGR